MKIIRKGNPIKERTYLVMIDVFILMCAMGVYLGILFITLSPAFGLLRQEGKGDIKTIYDNGKIISISIEKYNILVKMDSFTNYSDFKKAAIQDLIAPKKTSDDLKIFQAKIILPKLQFVQVNKNTKNNTIVGIITLFLDTTKTQKDSTSINVDNPNSLEWVW